MRNVKFYLRGHARSDIAQIRKYTLEVWGEDQWLLYKRELIQTLQSLANNRNSRVRFDDVSGNAFRFPLRDYVAYYLKRKNDVVFVGVLSNSMSPEIHLVRKQHITSELEP